jgi:APA family basic amino acid/polyamine antiporter
VCLGVFILRYSHPELKRPFKTPLVPFTPILGISACLFQMFCMPLITWFQFLCWHVIGVAIYFLYGIRKSRLRAKAAHHALRDTLY